MNNNQLQHIVTPRDAELITSSENSGVNNEYARARVDSNHISNTRLTCCCEYGSYIICAGFSGELLFVEKNTLSVSESHKICNSIIRSIKILATHNSLLAVTDASEFIVFNLSTKKIQFYEHSNSPIYCLLIKDSDTFITGERNGDIFEWEHIPNIGIFRNNKLFSAESAVFAMEIVSNSLVVVNSFGKKFEYHLYNSKLRKSTLCNANVFCLKVGTNNSLYYGVSTGVILFEESGGYINTLESHKDAVRDLIFSPRKEWIFSVSKDRTVRAWHSGVPKILTGVKDYLYQIIYIACEECLYYVDGYGDIGRISFDTDIDSVSNIVVITNSQLED